MNFANLFKKKPAVNEVPVEKKPEKVDETKDKIRDFVDGLVSTKDIIAPAALEVDFDFIRVDNKYYRTLFIAGYPRFVGINWLSPLINFDASLNISMYVYPIEGKQILDDLRRKITEMEAEISSDIQRGRIVNPATQAKLEDALSLQTDLVKGEERFFQLGLYVTISAESADELSKINKNLEAALGSLMIISKKATLQMEDGFVSTLPLCCDRLNITRNMDTTSLASTFPFVSSDLSDDKGIMYGINEHNGSLVIFDRFSMQNYNSVVFATAGAGKSYLIKLEALRSLMMGTDIIVIDPENEYRDLCEAAGGQYIAFGYGEASKINPFDLSLVEEEGENALNAKILSLHKLFKVMIGQMDPIEESILDKAIMDAYKMKGITPDPETQKKEAPLVEDLYKSLIGNEEEKARNLAARLEKYIKGSFAGIFNQKTTVNLTNNFVVFGIRNLEDALRPVAMHIILDYIWTVVKQKLRRRILVVDEAWYLMQYDDSAAFLRGIVKRGRKYYLGVTTITQDVDDFLQTPYGKEIVTNSSIQILLKQHSAAIDQIGEVFYLSEGEKQLLLTADKGEGIFFAGQNHVAIRVIASDDEHKLITSNPEEVMRLKAQKAKIASAQMPEIPSSKIQPQTQNIVSPAPNVPTAVQQIKTEEIKKEIKPLVEMSTGLPQIKTEEKTEPKPLTIEKPTEKVELMEVKKAAEIKPEEKVLFKVETVGGSEIKDVAKKVEDDLQKKIQEMEEAERTKIEEHKRKLEEEAKEQAKKEEEKKKLSGSFGGFGTGGGLPKYQDLFKANKLPPLPPLPKFETKPQIPPSPPLKKGGNEEPMKKPIFVDQPKEVKIPQPPQLQKQVKPTFVSPTEVTTNKQAPIVSDKSKTEEKKPETNKLDYDALFGNDKK